MSHSAINRQAAVDVHGNCSSSQHTAQNIDIPLIDSVPIALYRANKDGQILDGNKALASLLGFPDLLSLLEIQSTAPALPFLIETLNASGTTSSQESIESRGGIATGHAGRGVNVTTSCRIYHDKNGKLIFDGSLNEAPLDKKTTDSKPSSTKMLQNILDTLPLEIFWKDKDLNYLGCNSRFATACGLSTPEEIIGKSDHDLPWKEKKTEFYRRCDQKVIESGQAEFNINETKQNSDGSHSHIKANKIPLRNSLGEMIGILGSCEEINDQDLFTPSLGLMETVVADSPILVFRWMAEAGWPVDYVSDNIRNLGYSPEELLSGETSFASIVHPDDLQRVSQETTDYTLQGRDTFVQEYRLLCKNGEVRWFDERTKVEYKPDGSVLHYQGVMLDITDQKRVKNELLQFRSAIENSTALVGIADLKTLRHTYLNPAGMKLLGYDPSKQMKPLHLSAFHEKESLEVLKDKILPIVLQEGTWRGDNNLLRADGAIVPVDQSLFTISGASGSPEYLATFCTDRTEQKKAFESLRLNESRLEALVTLNKMTDASIGELVDFIMIEALKLTGSNLGYLISLADDTVTAHNYTLDNSPEKNEESPTITKVTLEDTEAFLELQELTQPVASSNFLCMRTICSLMPADIVMPERYMNIPIFDGKKIILIAGVANKVTDYGEDDNYQLTLLLQGMYSLIKKRKDREALEISQGLLSEAQALTDMAIWEYNIKTKEVKWSGRIIQTVGDQSPSEASGLDTILRNLHPDDLEKFKSGMERAIEGEQFREEFRIIQPDGRQSTYLGSTKTLVDSTGKPVRMIGIGQDITELKNIEEELRRHRDHLEELVEERTTELAAAKEIAESANTARSAFFTNMSHELRTPLTSILGFSRLLEREQGISSYQQEKLRVIQKSGEHLLALINDVLDMSKIEANKVEIVEDNFDISSFIRDTAEVFQVQAEEKNLIFKLVQKDNNGLIRCDRDKLRQILINLLGNAIKFTATGHIFLKASLSNQKSDNRADLQLTVEDTGQGISKEHLKTIFEPYIQSTQNFSVQSGTGLGLAICQRLIKLLGGKIDVDSQPGQGTTFSLSLPVLTIESSTVSSPKLHSGRVTGLAADSPTCSILIVEDNEMSRMLLYELLHTVGITVHQAANGREGIEAFIKWQPDLVLMDMRMPEVDGLEATQIIKQLSSGKDTPIVAITAQALKEEIQEIMSAGCDDYITKPFAEDRLFSVLGRLLQLKYIYSDMSPFISTEVSSPIFESAALLERVMGDRKFFVKMLTSFIASYTNADQQIKQLIATGDRRGASMLVHTIKGGAATISAKQLSEAAAEVECQIKKHSGVEQPDLTNFAMILKETLSTLGSYVE